MKVRTNDTLRPSTEGILVNKKYLDARKPEINGTLHSMVPGHGGHVWYIEHGNGVMGTYVHDEFEAVV